MQLKDVMTRDLEMISPDATLTEAAESMRALNIGAVPVCDGKKALGMITDRDIVVRGLAVGADPKVTTVKDVMTENVEWLFEDHDVSAAADLMREKQIRRILVLDRDQNVSGIVALGDLATESADDRLKGEVLEGISEPAIPAH